MMKSIIAVTMAATIACGSGSMYAKIPNSIQIETDVSFVDEFSEEINEALSLKRDSSFLERLEEKGIYYSFQDDMRVEKKVEDTITQ